MDKNLELKGIKDYVEGLADKLDSNACTVSQHLDHNMGLDMYEAVKSLRTIGPLLDELEPKSVWRAVITELEPLITHPDDIDAISVRTNQGVIRRAILHIKTLEHQLEAAQAALESAFAGCLPDKSGEG